MNYFVDLALWTFFPICLQRETPRKSGLYMI
jgi:hypothetical protein